MSGWDEWEMTGCPPLTWEDYEIQRLKREIKDRDMLIWALIKAAGGEIEVPCHVMISFDANKAILARTDNFTSVTFSVQ